MIEIIKLEKPTKQGVTKQAKFTNGENPVKVDNPTVVNATQELIDENKKLKAKVLELEYWQQLSNDFIRDHQKIYDKWKLNN